MTLVTNAATDQRINYAGLSPAQAVRVARLTEVSETGGKAPSDTTNIFASPTAVACGNWIAFKEGKR